MYEIKSTSVFIFIFIFQTKVVRSQVSARWFTRLALSATTSINQTALIGTPFWKVLSILTKILLDCSVSFTYFLY